MDGGLCKILAMGALWKKLIYGYYDMSWKKCIVGRSQIQPSFFPNLAFWLCNSCTDFCSVFARERENLFFWKQFKLLESGHEVSITILKINRFWTHDQCISNWERMLINDLPTLSGEIDTTLLSLPCLLNNISVCLVPLSFDSLGVYFNPILLCKLYGNLWITFLIIEFKCSSKLAQTKGNRFLLLNL